MSAPGSEPRRRRAQPMVPGSRDSVPRVAVASAARVVGVYAVLLVGYARAPWEHIGDIPAVAWLTGWLLVVAAMIGWQLRSVVRSTHPWARAAEAAALSVALLLTPFAIAYALMSRDDPASFTQPMTRVDALYFTVTVFATVGFGDLAAVAEPARVVVTVQMLADLVLIGVIVKVLAGAAQQRRRALLTAREADRTDASPAVGDSREDGLKHSR